MKRLLLVVACCGVLSAVLAAGCDGRKRAERLDAGDGGRDADLGGDRPETPADRPGDVPGDGAGPIDVSLETGPADVPPTCPAAQRQCPGSTTCVAEGVTACGANCAVCSAPTGGTATCLAGTCDFDCGALKKCAAVGLCIPATGCCMQSDCPPQNGKVGTCDTSTHTCNYDCAADMTACNGACIPRNGCCVDKDCPGSCQKCVNHACAAALNQDDPNARCSGTCDDAGQCKSKVGQRCTSPTASACLGAAPCVDGYCCDQACGATCMACDIAGTEGKCSLVATGGPHGVRAACASDGSACGGRCSGRGDGQCEYPTAACGSAMCDGTSRVIPQGTCTAGSCKVPAAQMCANNFACVAKACKTTCAADADCQSGNACSGGTCLPSGTFCDAAHPCGSGFNCSNGRCAPCGGASQACCASGGACQANLTCGSGNTCQCGGVGQACCNGSACTDDGNRCNGSEVCQQGTCQHSNPVVCAAQDVCHDVGQCQSATGACTNPPKTGGSCNDGNSCTQSDTCQAGTCVGTPLTCSSGQRCVSGSCVCDSTSCGSGCCSGNQCLQRITCYPDGDGDGYGNAASAGQQLCQTSCPAGTVTNKTDCYDVNPNVHPNAPFPNGISQGGNRGDGSYDFDCNNIIEYETKQQVECTDDCVLSGPFINNCTSPTCPLCFQDINKRTCLDNGDGTCGNVSDNEPPFRQRCR